MKLLEGIGESARKLTYDGVFIYRQGDDIETVRIIHRADERGERERLISLTGAPREVVRTDIHVTCVNSRRRSVFVEALPLQPPLSGLSISAHQDIDDHYQFSVGPGERVAGRKTTRLVITPRDVFRYGYALWIDQESGLLLRSDLMGEDGEVLEQMLYTQLRFADAIPDHLLDSPLLTDGYTVHEPVGDGAARPGIRREPQWRIQWVPEGFKSHQVIATEQTEGWSEHHLYSDGIATFSVYVEPLAPGTEPYEGLSTMGGLSAFGRVAGINQLVVVGEVPTATVTRVGDSVSAP
ncbi:MAG: MucB/RseB C-terminal domain-containing protein [Gammaproteobacteria bacterium]|nr:MucB/RseB C-terminal domain-containing protein [Gammaproteobacteria bacterium]